jgi:hypothetical protein
MSSKECVVLDLPSESREKSSQKPQKSSPCSWGAQHMYSRPSLPQKPVASTRSPPLPTWLLSEQPKQTHYQGSVKANSQPAPIGIRIIALRTRKPCMRANGNPIAKLERKLFNTPPSHIRTVTRPACAVARLAREINYCFLPPLWLRRAGMSHSLGSLRRTVTLSSRLVPWRSERLLLLCRA